MQLGHPFFGRARLRVAADAVEGGLELVVTEGEGRAGGPAHEEVGDGGLRPAGLLAEDVLADGDRPPAQEAQPAPDERVLENAARPRLRRAGGGQEDQADRQIGGRQVSQASRLQVRTEHVVRDLRGDAGAVARPPVGVDRPAVGEAVEGGQGEG